MRYWITNKRGSMTLEEILGDNKQELEQHEHDLGSIADMIDGIVAGDDVDPDLTHYAGMLLLSLSQKAPELPEKH